MDNSRAKKIFDDLYSDVDGYDIARKAQQNLSYYYQGNIYGEVTFEDFYKMLSKVKPKDGEVFYDLGSGTGKPSFIAYLCFNFSKVVGIEELTGLHSASKESLIKLQREYPLVVRREKQKSNIDFICGDFKKIDFGEADIIFLNATCFGYEISHSLFWSTIDKLKKGTRMIMSTLAMTTSIFEVLEIGKYQFSWGKEPVFVHVKK